MKLKIASSVAALLVAQASVLADDTTKLEEITVTTASGYEQKLVDAPASISVITQEDLQKKKYANLAEAIEDVEGVDVRDGVGKTGGLNISIRGMGSANTLVLIDGRRQNSSGNNTPNGFGETNNNFLPPLATIERIEVIRGPMSTLYGSDAMGGVINIITKRVSNEWSGSLGLDRTFNENSQFGDSNTVNTHISGPLVKDLLGLSLRASNYDRGASNIQYDDGGEVSKRGNSPVEGNNYSVGAKLNLTPVDNQDFYLDVFSSKQKYNNDKAQLGTLNTTTRSQGYDDKLRFEREQLTLGHSSRFNLGTLDSSIMRSTTETIGRLIPGNSLGNPMHSTLPNQIVGKNRELKNTDTVFDTKFVTNIFDKNIVTLGGQFWKSQFIDGMLDDKFSQNMYGLFLEDEISITDSFALTLGGRYDKHDEFGGNFSPRTYAVYTVNDNWTVKGGMSQGYKAPGVDDLYNGMNSVSCQGQIFNSGCVGVGNPDLKPEKSTNTEMGIYYNTDNGFLANATVFNNNYKDKISSINVTIPELAPLGQNGTVSKPFNVSKAETQGLELGTKIPLVETLDLKANYTFMQTEQKSGANEGEPFTNTPEHSLNATLNWETTSKLSTWIKGEYRSDRKRFTQKYNNLTAENKAIYDQVGNEINAYELFHLGGSYKMNKDLTFSATIYNLLDKDFFKREDYVFGGNTKYATSEANLEARRLWLGMNLTF